MTRDQILALIKANRPDLLAGRVVESLTDETLQSLLSDAMKPAAAVQATASTPTATTAAATASTTTATAPQYLVDMERRYQVSVTQARVIEALAEAKTLPELSRERIRKEFHDKVADAATIAVRIAEEREFVVRLLSPESGEVRQFGGSRSEVLAAPRDKIQAGLDRLIFRDMPVHEMETGLSLKNSPFNHDTVRRIQESWKGPMAAMKADRGVEFRGLRDAYCTITGDSEVTGQIVRGRASEALLSTTWAEVFANTLYRRFLMEYALPMYNERSIALFGSAQDFRTKETVVLGYFGDISSVDPEVNDYTEIATPGDDKVSYAVTQRGNILTISRKAIINDDIQGVSRLVARLGRAARRTLARFIWNFWTSNAVYDVDSVAWFNAAHGNTGTVALTADLTGANEVLAKIQQLADMVEQGSAEKLGLPPLESLWLDVPHALMGKAWQINDSREFGAGNVNPVLGMFGPPGDRANGRINVNPLYTDVTDWGVHMMPGAAGRESIQVDFLGGREEPEFFLADTPTIGQAFIGDKIQYKIRFEFGGDVSDVKGACKNIVAG